MLNGCDFLAEFLGIGNNLTLVSVSINGDDIQIEVRNDGGESLANIVLGIFLSLDKNIDLNDFQVDTFFITVGAGLTYTATVSIADDLDTSAVTAGDYYVGAMIDPEDQESELDELDNSGASSTRITVSGGGGTPGITVNPTSISTSESGSIATFDVVLTTSPSEAVTITVTSPDTGEGTVAPGALSFTSGNCNVVQTVTVSGVDDDVDDGDQNYTVALTLSSADSTYNAIDPDDVAATNNDDDVAAVAVTDDGSNVDEGGGLVVTVDVVLDSEPTASVTVDFTVDDATEGSVSPATLVFTSVNWDTPQSTVVSGVDDGTQDGDIAFDATYNTTSGDPLYDELTSGTTYTNLDDDAPPAPAAPSGLRVTAVSGSQLDLAWTDNASNEDGFNIERSTDGVSFTALPDPAADAVSASDTSLSADTIYFYRIRAFNAGGNSVYEPTRGIGEKTSGAGVPDLSGILTITSFDANQIDYDVTLDNSGSGPAALAGLSLDDNSDNIDVQAYLSDDTTIGGDLAAGGSAIVLDPPATGVKVIAAGGQAIFARSSSLAGTGNTRKYLLLDVDTGDEIAEANESNNVFAVLIPPLVATGLTADSVTESQVDFSWTDNAGNEDGYRIERSDAGGAYSAIAFPAADSISHSDVTVVASTVYDYRVVAINGSEESVSAIFNVSTGTGSSAAPFATPQKGLDQAALDAVPEVRVQAGTYQVATPVLLVPNVTLSGGFDISWARDPANNVTIIEDIADPSGTFHIGPTSAILAGSGDNGVVDGFTIRGTAVPGASGSRYGAALFCQARQITLSNNIIEGGAAASTSSGIVISSVGPSFEIVDNVIDGGTGAGGSRGIYNYSSDPTIHGNTINGGSGNRSYGIFDLFIAEPLIYNNVIDGGSGPTESFAFYGSVNTSGGATPKLYNNVLFGGTGGAFYAVHIVGNPSAAVTPEIVNNIIAAGGPTPYGIYEATPEADPVRVENNNFASASTALYFDEATTGLSTAAAINALGNAVSNVDDDPMLTDPDAGDYTFTGSSPTNVWQGGMDLTSEGISDDIQDVSRTVPWSIGPYEKDS